MLDLSREKLLVIAPHPDDEIIGCGGLIAKTKKAGGKVYVLFLTVADTHDFSDRGHSSAAERKKEIAAVAKYMKFDDYDLAFEGKDYHLQLDRLGQKALMDIIERKSRVSIEQIKPTIIAFPTYTSYNQDHQVAARAAHAALRPSHHSKHQISTALMYEMPAEQWRLHEHTEINYFVHLSDEHMKQKLHAIELYKSQVRPVPNPRAGEIVEAFAKILGSQSGASFAEGYVAYRMVT
ncbi:MAG TPA: PIG-L family deacetylase [Patescibacteria group bacterium]|nr:PIG-L family deacetylase [Patescibacteria group bacterium]